jgi:hypothetical protein
MDQQKMDKQKKGRRTPSGQAKTEEGRDPHNIHSAFMMGEEG